MNRFEKMLQGGDLRSIGQADLVVSLIKNQESFDELFSQLYHGDRKIVTRTADAIEKITRSHPAYLQSHKNELLKLCYKAKNIELKWHLSLIVTRVKLTNKEVESVWKLMTSWASDINESKIVRANAIQALFNLLSDHQELKQDFARILVEIAKEQIPSLNARIKKLTHRNH